jgi:hypothetical protein
VGFAGAPLELNQDVVQTLNLYGLTAGFSVLDVVLDVALDDARSVRRIQKHAAELRRDDFGQVFVLSDDVDFVFGEFAEVKAILQGQHTLYSQSVSFRNRRDVRVRLVLVVGRNYLDSACTLLPKSPIISSRAMHASFLSCDACQFPVTVKGCGAQWEKGAPDQPFVAVSTTPLYSLLIPCTASKSFDSYQQRNRWKRGH